MNISDTEFLSLNVRVNAEVVSYLTSLQIKFSVITYTAILYSI